jgi:hypothetical protein
VRLADAAAPCAMTPCAVTSQIEEWYPPNEVPNASDSRPESLGPSERREIVIPHEREIRPVTAIRNVVIQSSLAQLQGAGYYERYVTLIDPKLLEELMASLAPGWTPIELAHAHYGACDKLGLTQEEHAKLGQRIGSRLQETALVSGAKKSRDADFDVWTEAGPLHRMWARLYQGGSCQVVKLGPKDQLVELRAFSLSRYRYYRNAQLAGIGAAYEALGVRFDALKIASYHPARDELSFRLTWL